MIGIIDRMKRVGRFSIFRWISIGLIAAAVVLTVFQLVVFSRLRTTFTTGTKIAGVDVTGLTMEQAASRVTQAYSYPIELHYGENIIQVKPSTLGFSLNLTAIMTAADQARAAQPFWPSFFAYLFNQLPPSADSAACRGFQRAARPSKSSPLCFFESHSFRVKKQSNLPLPLAIPLLVTDQQAIRISSTVNPVNGVGFLFLVPPNSNHIADLVSD